MLLTVTAGNNHMGIENFYLCIHNSALRYIFIDVLRLNLYRCFETNLKASILEIKD